MSQLKVAQQKFGDSKENVKKLINKESGEKRLLIREANMLKCIGFTC